MTRTTTIRAMAVLAALGLGLTACSSSSHKSSDGSSKGSGATTGKPLVVEDSPVPSFSENFNPFVTSSASSQENTNALVNEPLFQINSLNSSQAPIPWLATSQTWSNGNKTLTLKLRSGVKWSDGQAFTADDVVFTEELMKKYPGADAGAPLVSSATASDPTTVVLNYATPQAANYVAIDLQLIVPKHVWEGLGDPTKAVVPAAKTIGTGPFTVSSFSSQKVVYKSNPNYWGGKPKVPEVDLPAIASNDAAQLQLAQGNIDLTGNNIPNVQNVFLAKDPAHNHLYTDKAPYFAGTNTVSLFMNQKAADAPALKDAKVRQAISAGIDRTTLGNQCETGYEAPATSSGGLIAPTAGNLVPSSLQNDLKASADTAKVTSILTADGYTKTGGKWTKGGKTIKFTVLDPEDYSDYYCGAKDIASQLTSEGFDVTQVTGVQSTEWAQDIAEGKFDTAIHWGQGATPFLQLQYVLDNTQSAAIGSSAAGDPERYTSSAAQTALTKYEGDDPTDTASLTTDLQALESIVSTDVPAAPLLYGAAWYEYNDANYTGWPNSDSPYMNPSPNSQAYEYIILKLQPTS